MIGEKFTTREGYIVTVIAYRGCHDVRIKFPCGLERSVQASNLRAGKVKNPLHPSVFNTGYVGVGDYKACHKTEPAYTAWSNLMARCFGPGYQKNRPNNMGGVSEDWLNYQTFAEWHTANYAPGLTLMKTDDLYSEDTCWYGEAIC